ncbi:CaiB/BaiF CoA transferase family protein [Plastorhodobacter daqingensis]|uniref:CaiB/BaiF CoA transferase family protein n=1 Tax=Plastorhodobacter daqingensis TaxID=1387281 RepID=A0ABW2UQS0_9RHOB
MLERALEHAEQEAAQGYPLEGLTVLDLTQIYNGPYATFLMALGGAKVIKVEPRAGENLRSRGDLGGVAYPFAMLNSNKKPVTLNLKSERGKDLLRQMASKADVLVENFSPGVMERLGLGAESLLKINPRLIYGSSSGYGSDGPYRNYPAMDLVMQAMCGVINSTGFQDGPPVKSGAALCDFFAGIHLHSAIMMALYHRERTGTGKIVEVSMQDATYCSLASNYGMYHALGDAAPERTGNRHGGLGVAPYNAYPARDGYVVVNAPADHHWQSILRVIGREDLKDDERLKTRAARVINHEQVDELLETWIRTRTKDDAAAAMLEQSVPCAPVRNLGEVMNDRNMLARGALQAIDHPDLGHVNLPHTPLNIRGVPRIPIEPSRPLGDANEEVFVKWLGHSREDLERLEGEGVI